MATCFVCVADLKLVDHIETIANPKGLCALCPSASNTVLACPGVSRGTVRIELYDLRKTTLITAHEAELSQVDRGCCLRFPWWMLFPLMNPENTRY